ncbi:hypothetical protein TIFTF001_027764 [Ficus carica]|uniref:Uncharacterized protein n=1 Tax=Ficus carica TaxID=3494 RepID=A0AA88DNJ9_FICCA|nr:hypothetical protein TIFTF001_027764 [Ficus carica]
MPAGPGSSQTVEHGGCAPTFIVSIQYWSGSCLAVANGVTALERVAWLRLLERSLPRPCSSSRCWCPRLSWLVRLLLRSAAGDKFCGRPANLVCLVGVD